MWRNYETLEFVHWLKSHNDFIGFEEKKVGFYGLDLYSLYASINEIIKYLLENDPNAVKRSIARYSCFDHHNKEAHNYGEAVNYELRENCREEAIAQLVELEKRAYKSL